MNKNLKVIFITFLLAAALLIISRAASIMQEPSRVWVDGIELTSGMVLEVGGGMAEYEPEKKLLTLTNASITRIFGSSLNIELRGKSAISGEANGIQVLATYMFSRPESACKGQDKRPLCSTLSFCFGRASLNAEGSGLLCLRGIHISRCILLMRRGKAAYSSLLVTLSLAKSTLIWNLGRR